MWADEQADVTKLRVAFLNFKHVLKMNASNRGRDFSGDWINETQGTGRCLRWNEVI
jgi:hypothetical protein